MVVPGLSTARVPARVRLYLAIMLAFVLAPLVVEESVRGKSAAALLFPLIVRECVIGLLIGLLARLVIEMLSFAGIAIASYVGLSALAGSTDGDSPQPAVASVVTLIGTILLVLLDFPLRLIVLLAESYSEVPLGSTLGEGGMLQRMTAVLKTATVAGLQLSGPFLMYGLVVNALFAVLGKLVPQISSYFISGPFIAIGGLAILYLLVGELFGQLTIVFEAAIFLR